MMRAGFVKDESGATAVEYSLVAGLVFTVIVGAVTLTGVNLFSIWQKIGTAVASAAR